MKWRVFGCLNDKNLTHFVEVKIMTFIVIIKGMPFSAHKTGGKQ